MTGGQVTGAGIGELIREVVPPWMVPLFLLITRLGNPAFFFIVFTLDYWFANDRRGAHALSLAIGAIALITALKTYFDAPRPPEAVNLIPISGYSFPSGHATSATIGYGILAFDLEVGSRRSRFAVATLLVVLIALSRVVLGVHFVRDVLAGIFVGLVFLAAAISLTKHDPGPGFGLALLLGVAALVVSGASHDGVAVFGMALGAAGTWWFLDRVPTVESDRNQFVLLGGALPVLAGIGYAGAEVAVALPVVFVLSAVLSVGVLMAPFLASRIRSQ